MSDEITFDEAVKLLQKADVVVIYPQNDAPTKADFVGWEEEGNENSDFIVGADGFDDLYICRPKQDGDDPIVGTFVAGRLFTAGNCPIGLYVKMER